MTLATAAMAVWASLQMAFFMFWDTLWALVLGFTLSGAVQAFVSRAEMQRALGARSLPSIARATGFGMISSSCSYAATAVAKSLFQKGADFVAALTFMFASTNLVIELGIVLWVLMGWQFVASEFLGGVLMIALLSAAAGLLLRPRLVEAARKRLQAQGEAHGAEAGAPRAPWRTRLTSLAGWSDAAGYTVADVTMLRRELLIGYVVAGFLAVLVPTSLWNALFLRGHGFWTSLENVIIGPFIAIVSFVCSVGNVPLAAALWAGGISFGGVVSFIFADLISFPLLAIYRKYYGGKLALRMLALFWLVMSMAGLLTELVFQAAGLVPSQASLRIVEPPLQWSYTTVLNLIAVVAFLALLWLERNRARFGGGAGYANDPVCGMQVEIAQAPAEMTIAGRTYYFCSDHCRQHFAQQHEGAALESEPREAASHSHG